MTGAPILAVAVVVPARDEEANIGACLSSVRAALARVPADVATGVTVVLDRCVDRTPQLVAELFADWPGSVALRVAAVGGQRAGAPAATGTPVGPTHIVAGSGVGALRDLGVRDALARLRPHPPESVWVLNTDADTVVPPDWALAHLRLARAGAAGVAGTVELAAGGGLSTHAARRHELIVLDGVDGDRHRHVYGANLGVRGDAYLAAGGFPADGAGEDHGLWAGLRWAGFGVRQPTAVRVRTSARIRGRAAGGLADLLRELHGCPDERYDDAPPAG